MHFTADSFIDNKLQKKLEAELQTIEGKHEEKKRKFQEASEQFHEELKKVL